MNALTECYSSASTWDTVRRQFLSIMADKVTFQTLKKWIPDLTGYRLSTARKDTLLHGRGVSPPQAFQTKLFVSPTEVDQFSLGFSLVLLVLKLSRTCHSVRRPSHCPQRYSYVNPRVHCKTIPCICRGIQFYSSLPQNSVKHSFSLFSFYKKVLTRSRLYQFSRSSGLSRSHRCRKMLGRPPNGNDLGKVSENASCLLSAT